MPNCDFYAIGEDLEQVLHYVFVESGCEVYELYSPFGQELARFDSIADVQNRYPIGLCQGNSHSVLLQLLPAHAGPLVVERISLNPRNCKGATYRYTAAGWGLIQLYLGGVSPKAIVRSHTNHNSEKRAKLWEQASSPALGSPSAWNWRLVESASRKLNARIRRLAAEIDGPQPVLPAAALERRSHR